MRLLIAFVLAAVTCAQADSFERTREFIRKELVGRTVPSVAVAVARGGKIVWEEGFGWADRESRVAATEHTMYSLASISKPITATGLMILRERGQIDLDRPINDYLGEAKVRPRVNDAVPTVRQVANHTAGLPLHYHFFYEDEPYRPPSMDETIRRYANLVTIPGEKYQYSNLGYGVLDHVIARVSGKSYADFMRQEVFLPLGLTHTSAGVEQRLEKYYAVRYGADGLPIPYYDFDHRGGSAVWASAHDLVRFGMFHLKARLRDQKAILSEKAIDEMQKPTAEQPTKGLGYGIGWMTNRNRTYPAVSHSGSMGGVTTLLTLIPSERIAVAVLANTNTDLPGRITQEIVATLLPHQKATDAPAPEKPREFRPPSQLLAAWHGSLHTYKGDTPISLRFFESGDVHVQLGTQMKTLLNGVSFEDDWLSGQFAGDVGTEDASRRPHLIRLSLKLRGNVLNGAATALSLPGKRAGNALSHWVELKKQ